VKRNECVRVPQRRECHHVMRSALLDGRETFHLSLSLSLYIYIYIYIDFVRCLSARTDQRARPRNLGIRRDSRVSCAARKPIRAIDWHVALISSRLLARSRPPLSRDFLPVSYDNARVISGPRSALPSSAAQEPPQRARKHGTSFTEAFCRTALLRFRVIVSEHRRQIFLLISLADVPHERCLVIQSADRGTESVALPRSRLQE